MSQWAVELERVCFAYPGAEMMALQDVSLRVRPGERLGILGPNGGGKSTLLRLILGLQKGYSGTIQVFGEPPQVAQRRGLIGYVPQRIEAERLLPVSVRQVVSLGAAWRDPWWRGISAEKRGWVAALIELVGAGAFADRPIGTLSGGQMQRILIARALASRPMILAMDEPMVGIDAIGQQQFAELLGRIHAELRITMLVISHDLRAIAAASDRVACLAGRLHSHTSPEGLTPAVLAELFSHDVAGLVGGLGPVHVEAHRAAECPSGHDLDRAHVHGSRCDHPPATGSATERPAAEGGHDADH